MHIQAARLLFALRAFEEAKGALPASLPELVPDFIDAVPPDPFDGKPIRYSPEKRIIWSVGQDREDRGGSAWDEGEEDVFEPTFRIHPPPGPEKRP